MPHLSRNKLKSALQLLILAGLIQNYHLAIAQDVLASDINTINLPEINVVGSADKSGGDFKTTAQSVSIINEQTIRDNGANRQLDEILGYEAGMVSKQFVRIIKPIGTRLEGSMPTPL